MDNITPLLYSYARTAAKWEATGDPSYKKTLGMFRMRLRNQGVRVQSMLDDGDFFVLELDIRGTSTTERLRKPADL